MKKIIENSDVLSYFPLVSLEALTCLDTQCTPKLENALRISSLSGSTDVTSAILQRPIPSSKFLNYSDDTRLDVKSRNAVDKSPSLTSSKEATADVGLIVDDVRARLTPENQEVIFHRLSTIIGELLIFRVVVKMCTVTL